MVRKITSRMQGIKRTGGDLEDVELVTMLPIVLEPISLSAILLSQNGEKRLSAS
jgi:hypothetical protein